MGQHSPEKEKSLKFGILNKGNFPQNIPFS
jgi:hypothetical protein